MSVNKVILVGRLGRDPESRFTGSGQQVCNFSIATDEVYKDRNGERQKRTEWHRIVMWGKLAEICQQYLKRGTLVYIEGRLQTREWEDRSTGNKRQSTEVVGSAMKMLSPRGEGSGPRPAATAAEAPPEHEAEAAATATAEEPVHGPEISDEDIPF